MLHRCAGVITFKLALYSATCCFLHWFSRVFSSKKIGPNPPSFAFAARNLEFSSFPADSKADTAGVAPSGDRGLVLQLDEHSVHAKMWSIRSAWMQMSPDSKKKNRHVALQQQFENLCRGKKKGTAWRKRNEKDEFVSTDLKGCHSG